MIVAPRYNAPVYIMISMLWRSVLILCFTSLCITTTLWAWISQKQIHRFTRYFFFCLLYKHFMPFNHSIIKVFFYHVWYKYVNHMLKYTQRNRLCRYFVMDLNDEKVLKCLEKTLNQWFYTWKYAWNASCISDRGWAVSLKECEISRRVWKKEQFVFLQFVNYGTL